MQSSLNSGVHSTILSPLFAEIHTLHHPAGTRFIQVQKNLPGELGRLNAIFDEHGVNIASQHYQNDSEIGYVVLEEDHHLEDAPALLKQIQAMPNTIRTQMLQEAA